MPPIKVDIWSDLCCPFCYLGERKLEAAIKQTGLEVVVNWHSFELDQTSPPVHDEALVDILSSKLGAPFDRLMPSMKILEKEMEEWGIDYNWREVKLGNTFNAHRLLKMAETKGLGDECRERLYKAAHTDGLSLGQKPVLRRLASELGLPSGEVEEMLEGIKYTKEVRADEDEGTLRDINAVPHFVFDDRHSISGAQRLDLFVAALRAQETGEPFAAEGCRGGACRAAK